MSVKILHILKSVGGVEVSVRMINQHLDPQKVECLIAHEDPKKKYHNINGEELNQYIVPLRRELSIFNDIRCIRLLLEIIKKEKPHKIHCHSAKAGLIGRFVGFLSKTPVIYTPQALSYLSTRNNIKRFIYLTIERITKFQSTTYFLASSNSEKDRGLKEIGYKVDKCGLWNNSIPPITIDDAIQNDQKYICTLSRPSYQKNVEMLVEAMNLIHQEHPNLKLKIIGAGYYAPNTQNIRDLILKYKLDQHIEIIEWCDQRRAHQYLKNAEFIVSTARYEGLPFALIESLSLGKACVATEVDGNQDLIIDKYNGFLTPTEDYNKFAEKVISLLNQDELRGTFEKNSLTHFNKNFNVHNNIHLLENLYLS